MIFFKNVKVSWIKRAEIIYGEDVFVQEIERELMKRNSLAYIITKFIKFPNLNSV